MLRQILNFTLTLIFISEISTAVTCAADNPSDELLQQIVKLIRDPDREFRAAALDQLRSGVKGTAATELFASQLANLDGEAQAALLGALADRGDAAARPAVLAIATSSKDAKIRAKAIAALGYLGNASDVSVLIKALSAENAEQEMARQSLVRLGGDSISKSLASELKAAPSSVKTQLIEVLATRRASGELPAIVKAAVDENAQVRRAAMNALGQLGRPEHIAVVLPGVLKAQEGDERESAEKNVALICARIANEDERGTRVIEALNAVPAADRDKLLSLVGRVGGKKLINFVSSIAMDADAARRRLGIDALSNWPDSSVADKLLELADHATDAGERRQAFEGYVKIAATRDNRNDKERLERMKQAMNAAKTPEEKMLILNRTRTAYDVDSVRFVLPYVDQPPFAQIACETIVEIAHHREVRDPNKAEFDKVLDKVIATSKDDIVVERAKRYKRGETWERPKKK